MRITDINLPPDWITLAERVLASDGPVLILGARDTGKSTLTRYLLGRLVEARGTAALLDGDVSLPTVGLPGLLGLSLVADVDSLDERPRADRLWYVGSTHTADRLVPMVVGHTRLIALARETGIGTIVDTTSALPERASKELLMALHDVVQPALVAGVTVGEESEYLLAPLERTGATVMRVSASPRARAKPRSYGEHLRAERLTAYFEEGREVDLDISRFAIEGSLLGSGTDLEPAAREEIERGLDAYLIEGERAGDSIALVTASEPHDERAAIVLRVLECADIVVTEAAATGGLMTGLLAEDGECLGIGLLDAWKGDGMITLFTPLDDTQLGLVKRLALGSLRLGRTGEALGTWARERSLAPPAELPVPTTEDGQE